MFIIQTILSVILLLRIGGILLKRISVNDENRWLGNFCAYYNSLIGIVAGNWFDRGSISRILIYISIAYISVSQSQDRKNSKGVRMAYIIAGIFLMIFYTLPLQNRI